MRYQVAIVLLILFTIKAESQTLIEFLGKRIQTEDSVRRSISERIKRGEIDSVLELSSGVAYPAYMSSTGRISYVKDDNAKAAETSGTYNLFEGGRLGLSLSGRNYDVGVWEVGIPNVNHQELIGRISLMDGGIVNGSVSEPSNHATHVAGTIGAAGINSSARGMANGVNLMAYTSESDLSEMASEALGGLLISNHSYGFIRGWEDGSWYGDESISDQEDYLFGFYDSQARAWDELAYLAPNLLICKSAGNDRGDSGEGHPQDGNGGFGYDCIGHAGNAKNILTIGAVNHVPNYSSSTDITMSSFSSWGPTDDGRIKPDIVAMGVGVLSAGTPNDDSYGVLSGTSMAAPNTAGSLILLQELHESIYGEPIKSASLKGLLIHTAKPAGGSDGPDYSFGWGLLDASASAEFIINENFGVFSRIEDKLSNQEIKEYHLEHPGGPIRLTATWTDLPGTVPPASLDPTNLMLVNDLDFVLVGPDQQTYMPWILDPSIPSKSAEKGDNYRDNVEQIDENLPAGQYLIRVTHKANLVQDQDYSILITTGENESVEALYWVGGSGNWLNGSHWSTSSGGQPEDVTPTTNSIVIFDENSQLDGATVVIDQPQSCKSISVFGNSTFTIQAPNISLGIGSFVNLKNENLTIDGLTIELGNGGKSNLQRVTNESNLEGTELIFPSSQDWVIDPGTYGIIRIDGNLDFEPGEYRIEEIIVESNGESNNISMNNVSVSKLRNFLFFGEQDDSFTFSRAELSFEGPGQLLLEESTTEVTLEFYGETTIVGIDRVDGLAIRDTGAVVFEDSGIIGTLEMERSSSISIFESETVEIDTLIIHEGLTPVSFQGLGLLISNEVRRLCLENISIDGLNVGGNTIWVVDALSPISGSPDGWIDGNCEDLLFANFEVSSPCSLSQTLFIDQSTGMPSSWNWDFGDGTFSTQQNATNRYIESGTYHVHLNVSDGESEQEFSRNVIISEGVQVQILGDGNGGMILRSSVSGYNYKWYDPYNPETILSTSSFISASAGNTYVLEVFDDDCSFVSEPFVITGSAVSGQVGIYPNPVENELIITGLNNRKVFVEVYSSAGQLIINNEVEGILNVNELEGGLYFLVIKTPDGSNLVFRFRKV